MGSPCRVPHGEKPCHPTPLFASQNELLQFLSSLGIAQRLRETIQSHLQGVGIPRVRQEVQCFKALRVGFQKVSTPKALAVMKEYIICLGIAIFISNGTYRPRKSKRIERDNRSTIPYGEVCPSGRVDLHGQPRLIAVISLFLILQGHYLRQVVPVLLYHQSTVYNRKRIALLPSYTVSHFHEAFRSRRKIHFQDILCRRCV